MALKVLHSFVHTTDKKVTSLTVSLGSDGVILTMSDRENKLRMKLSLDEVAGLADAIKNEKSWSAYHTFEKEEGERRARLSYSDGFLGIEVGKRIAIRLDENEKASLWRVLDYAFHKIIDEKSTFRQ